MPVIKIQGFGGIAPAVPARYLTESQAQIAINCPVFKGSIQPLADVGSSLLTLPKTGVPQTIYRYGQDTISDTSYWFHWTTDVDVCRGQISGDTSEWTYFTGDGAPKATFSSLALTGSNYPADARRLGLPAPTGAPTVVAASYTPPEHEATVYLIASDIARLTTTDGLQISILADEDADYTTVSLTGTITEVSVASAINTALSSDVTATAVSGEVQIVTTATGPDAKLYVRYKTGETVDTTTTPTNQSPTLSGVGAADTAPYLVIEDGEIGSISSGDVIQIKANGTQVYSLTATGTMTASSLRASIAGATSAITATVFGSCVVLQPNTSGGASLNYNRTSNSAQVTDQTSSSSEAAAPARVFLTSTNIEDNRGDYLELTVNGADPDYIEITDLTTVDSMSVLEGYDCDVTFFGALDKIAMVTTRVVGSSASLSIKGATFGPTPTYRTLSDTGYSESSAAPETRVYTYTWVSKEGGVEVESAPAPASSSLEVVAGQTVQVSGFDSVPSGSYNFTHKRIYRSVSGTYLYVDEVTAAASTYDDSVSADSLGEVLPSLYYAQAPDAMVGLTNLPNGMMAGFVGRDVYFCEPYRPYAWPENYIQTVDYPVVGLGRMDSTLAVLTTGVPYLMQGSNPASIAVIKSDLEQACVSKRSIVSFGSAVLYAAPDGLMMLSTAGSRIVTSQLFNYQQWQTYFAPSSIHAYAHDNQYIGFYDNGTDQGGFIFDVASGQFILHDIYASCGYRDLQRDKLFLAFADRSVKVWYDGSAKSYVWKSKKFTLPQVGGFSCAQLEAESYPMTMKFYVDGSLTYTKTVSSRDPFRLPAKVGRDWEMQVEGSSEVFAVALSTSMTELASA